MNAVITPEFIDRIIGKGDLTQAWQRLQQGQANPRNQAMWDRFSSWSLICEEIVDTEYPAEWHDDILAELIRRGFSFDQINEMRRFAWRTAGWLNYDKMVWDWVGLNEDDIKRALDWQLREERITCDEHGDGLYFLRHLKWRPAED